MKQAIILRHSNYKGGDVVDAHSKLKDFLCDNSDNLDVFVENCEKYGVSQIFHDDLCGLTGLNDDAMLDFFIQSQQNENVENEIKNLSSLFSECGIKIVFIKGLPLAFDVYDEPDLRMYGDIDVLIDFNNLSSAIDIFNSEGYLVIRTNNPLNYEEMVEYKNLHNNSIQHFGGIYKTFDENGLKVRQELELHISLYPYLDNKFPTMSKIVADSILQDFYGNKIYVLELHDRLIHLLYHLVKDYGKNELNWTYLNEKKTRMYFNLKLLHDISLLLNKYIHSINWSLFIEKTQTYGKCNEVLIACRLVEHIYDGCFPLEVLEELNSLSVLDYEKFNTSSLDIRDFWLNPLGMLKFIIELNINAELILKRSLPDVVGEILRQLPTSGIIFCNELTSFCLIEKSERIKSEDVSSSIILLSSDGSDYPSYLKKPTNINLRGKGNITTNINGIDITLSLAAAEISNNAHSEFAFYYCNYKHNKKYKAIFPYIMFKIGDDGKLYYEVKNVYLHLANEYDSTYYVGEKNGFVVLTLSLSWEFLGFNLTDSTEILFDISMCPHILGKQRNFSNKPKREYLHKLLHWT